MEDQNRQDGFTDSLNYILDAIKRNKIGEQVQQVSGLNGEEDIEASGLETEETEALKEDYLDEVENGEPEFDDDYWEDKRETIELKTIEELKEEYPYATNELLECYIRHQEAFINTFDDIMEHGFYGETTTAARTGAHVTYSMLRNQLIGLSLKLYPYSKKAVEYRRHLLEVKVELSTKKNAVDPMAGIPLDDSDPAEIDDSGDGAYDLGTSVDPEKLVSEVQ